MILRSLPILLLNLVLIAIALLLTYNIITHYDDGGCDGGACAILFFYPYIAYATYLGAFNIRAKFFIARQNGILSVCGTGNSY